MCSHHFINFIVKEFYVELKYHLILKVKPCNCPIMETWCRVAESRGKLIEATVSRFCTGTSGLLLVVPLVARCKCWNRTEPRNRRRAGRRRIVPFRINKHVCCVVYLQLTEETTSVFDPVSMETDEDPPLPPHIHTHTHTHTHTHSMVYCAVYWFDTSSY